MWFNGKGKLVYDPNRGKMKKKVDWWSVIEVDKEITRYYRWWAKEELGIALHQPSWDAHISVVRGEVPRGDLKKLWKKYQGREIDFRYRHELRQSGDTTKFDRPNYYWFVEVESDWIQKIRFELGLITKYKYHLTIGRTY